MEKNKFLRFSRHLFEEWMFILGRNAQHDIQNCFANPTPRNFDSTLRSWRDWAFALYYLLQWAGDEKTKALMHDYLERFYALIRGLETVSLQMTIVHDPSKTRETSQHFFDLLVGR